MSLTQEQAKGSGHCVVVVEGVEFFSPSRDIFLFFQNSTSLFPVTAGASTRVRAACHQTLQLSTRSGVMGLKPEMALFSSFSWPAAINEG